MDLMAACREHGWTRIAFIGATKHAGKTTAMNRFISDAAQQGAAFGLCSIGLDGERLDTILGVEKPAVYAPEGTIVASAEKVLEQSDAGLEWLEVLPVESPLGSVAVCRVTRPGNVVLAGIRQRAHVDMVMPRLAHYGANMRLVDGAFDRIAAAAPDLVDAAVLAVGAVAGKTVADVVRHAQPFLQRFLLPELSGEVKERLHPAYSAGAIGWLTGDECHVSTRRGALFGITSDPAWTNAADTVYLPGAITDSVIGELLNHELPLTIVAGHPAQILIGTDTYRKLYRAGHSLTVWKTLPVLAVACNPHSITGYDLPRQDLMTALREIAPGLPVYDPLFTEEPHHAHT